MESIPGFPPPEPGSPAPGQSPLTGRAFALATMPTSLRLAISPVDKRPRPNRQPLAAAILCIALMSSLGWLLILGIVYLSV